ncbi:MAG: hypothetical protein ACTSYI_15080 [Promethearchaeota archaeon]
MEKLNNLLKIKEEEIEKLGNLRNALKRKVVELNDKLSLKDIKISTLKEDLQQKTVELESLQQMKGNSNYLSPQPQPKAISPSVEKKIDLILSTLQQMGTNAGLSAAPPRTQLRETPPSYTPKAPSSQSNLRSRLKPVSSEPDARNTPSSPIGSPKKSKRKMLSPIVNVAKIQNISTPGYGSDVHEQPSSPPSTGRRPSSVSQMQFNDVPEAEDYSLPPPQMAGSPTTPAPASKTGGGLKVEMGMYGVPTFPYPEDGLMKCPKCGGIKIQESENKKKIVMYNPRKYGKKMGCKDCRFEWDYSY